ncbi:MAG TPA: DUF2911 domain-containing protein [Thermoanaerobaculia bacterium]|nr:DUF2911 domain-containing protein [Thermoanaerobaculia bacterium]
MKSRFTPAAIVAAAAILATAPAFADLKTPRPSPNGSVMQTIGVTDVTVTYSRPSVKGRVIWGELVPFDAVWRTGANEATRITFSDDVMVAGKKLAAGTYSLHTLPGKAEWTVIFNSVADQWGSYSYDEKKDVLRVSLKPEAAPMTELMTFSFPQVTASTATLALDWEKVRLSIPIEVDTPKIVRAKAKEAVATAKADDWRTPLQASRWARDAKLPEADEYLEKSIAAKPTFGSLSDKAKAQAEKGKKADAIATGEKALAVAKTQDPKPAPEAVAAFEKTLGEWKNKK